MAQFDFYGMREDSFRMLEALFDRGDLVAHLDADAYDRPEPRSFTALTVELRKELCTWHRLMFSGSFSTHPVLMRQQQTGPDAGKFFLSENRGGPLITFIMATEGFGAGYLSTQPEYQLTPGHYEKPSQAVKDAYADMVKRMKKAGPLIRYKGLVWITPTAKAMHERGEGRIGLIDGFERPPSIDETPRAA
jgi:hypothetical protein